jgi:hypothetical protein
MDTNVNAKEEREAQASDVGTGLYEARGSVSFTAGASAEDM